MSFEKNQPERKNNLAKYLALGGVALLAILGIEEFHLTGNELSPSANKVIAKESLAQNILAGDPVKVVEGKVIIDNNTSIQNPMEITTANGKEYLVGIKPAEHDVPMLNQFQIARNMVAFGVVSSSLNSEEVIVKFDNNEQLVTSSGQLVATVSY